MNQDSITPEKFYELEKQYKLLKIRDKEKTKSIKELESEIGNKNNMLHKKDGELAHMVERHHIEGRSAEMISDHLEQVYEEFC